MSKESIKARERKRIRAVEKYAEKRKSSKKQRTTQAYNNYLVMQALHVFATVAN